jgi:hypothetical protein
MQLYNFPAKVEFPAKAEYSGQRFSGQVQNVLFFGQSFRSRANVLFSGRVISGIFFVAENQHAPPISCILLLLLPLLSISLAQGYFEILSKYKCTIAKC